MPKRKKMMDIRRREIMFNNINDLLEQNKKFAENRIKNKRSFTPQVVMSISGKPVSFVLTGNRESIRKIVDFVEKVKKDLDWCIIMHEGYMDAPRNESERLEMEKEVNKRNYLPGSLEERYLAGDKRIRWVFVLQAWFGLGGCEKSEKDEKDESDKGKLKFDKKMRVYNIQPGKLNFVLETESEDFQGYLVPLMM